MLADTAVAQVVSVETSRQFRVVRVRIDRSGVEVKPGMPVIAAEGVVGRIARSVGPYAEVQLLTDARSAVDVVLPRSESRGVMKGTGSDSRYVCRVEYVLKKEAIEIGDNVLTSGLGGSFPRDLPVGKVVAVRRSDASLYDYGLASYDSGDTFDQSLAHGFIELWGLPSRMAYARDNRIHG